jgi:hypothetical protein
MDILQKSFAVQDGVSGLVASLGLNEEGDNVEIVLDSKSSATLYLAIEDYISERRKEYGDSK